MAAHGNTGLSGSVVVSIADGSYTDLAGNAGKGGFIYAAVPSVDTAAPAASISIALDGEVTISFSEPVKGFDASDVKVAGGTLLDLVQQPDGSWKGHAVSNDPTGTPGKVELSIAAGGYTDHAGNPGQAAAQSQTVPSIDVTAPSSSIQLSADGDIVILFNEPVKGFDASDVKVAGGTLISLTEQADGTWTGKVAANGTTGTAGSIAVEVAASSYTDLAGNAGQGSTAVQVIPIIDSTAPVSAMTLDADGSLRISFSEAVKGFDASDVQVSGGTVSGLSQQADGSWTGHVTADGSTGASAPVTVTVADGSYSDLAGNAGKGSSANNVSVPSIDSTAPAVMIGLDENGLVKFTFSEKVFHFNAADVNVTGGTLTDFVKVSDTLWTAKVQPAVSGVTNFVKLAIDAGSYQDKAGNQGLKGDASGDIIPPTVGIDDFDFFAASFAAPVAMFAARTMLAAAPLPPATNNPSQTFSGTSTKSVEVRIHIYDSSNQLIDSGLAKLDTATGRWTFTPSKPLADGLFTLEAISTDASGLVSAPSYKDFIIDTVKPEIEIDQAGTAAAPSFSGKTEAGSTVTVTVKDKAGNVVETGAGIVDAQGSWTYSAKALADGDYTVEAAAKDRAGNVSDKASTPLTVDTQAQLDGLTVTANADGTATLSGKTEPGTAVTVKDPNGKYIPVTVNPDGTFTASVPAPVAEGIYTATATDQAGNRGTAAEELKDAVAPKIDGFNVESHPDGTATLSGKTEPGASVAVKDPNGKDIPVTVNPDGTFTASVPAPAAEGTYTATATDQAGNKGHASDDLTDTTVPGLLTAEVNQNNGATVFGQAQPGALITVYSTDGKTVLGKGTVDASGQYTVSLNPVQVDGESVKVTVKDPGGESLPKMASAPDLYAPDAPAAQVTADGKAVTGSTEPNAEITVYGGSKGTTVLAVSKADANGSYTVALNPALVDGEAVKVTAKDPGGESLAAPAIAPDLYAPAAPEAALDAQGQNVTGHSEAFAEITVYSADGKTILAQDKADSAGHFSIQLPSALTDAQQILVTARDKGGESDPKALTAQSIAMDVADNLVTANVDFIYPVEETRTSKLFNVFDAVNIGTKAHAGYFNVGDQEIGDATISVKTGSLVNLFDKAEMRLFQMDADGSWKLIASNKDSGLLDIFGLFGEGAAVRANNLQPGNYKFEFVGGSAIGLCTSVSANLSLKVFDTSVNPAVSGTAEATGNVISDTDSVYGKDSVPAGSVISSVNGQAVNGATVIDGAYGSLTIQKDGSYSYAPKADVAAIGKADVFSYAVKDPASGKESTAELFIHIGTQSDLALNWNDSHPKEDASTVAATDNKDFIGVDASNTVTAGKAGSISYSWAIGAGGTKSGSTKLTVADGTIEDVKISFGSVQLASFLGGTVVNIYDKAHKLIATTGASTMIDIITLLPNGNSLNLNGLKAGEYTVEAITNKGFSIFGSVSATISRSVIDLDDFTVKSTAVQSKGNIFSDNDGHGADTLASKYTDLYISKDGGLTYTAVKSTGTEIEGQYGKLYLKSDGSYTYTATDAKALSGHSEEFTYKLAAPNGDASTASLSIQASVNFTASTGNDVITSTAGNDVFNAKTGADTIIFKVLNSSDAAGGNGHDTWADFSKAQGDKIDVSQLLQGQGVDKSNIGQFISVAGDGKGNTVISIDRDGLSVKAHDKVELLTLKNTDIGLQELLDNNHLVF